MAYESSILMHSSYYTLYSIPWCSTFYLLLLSANTSAEMHAMCACLALPCLACSFFEPGVYGFVRDSAGNQWVAPVTSMCHDDQLAILNQWSPSNLHQPWVTITKQSSPADTAFATANSKESAGTAAVAWLEQNVLQNPAMYDQWITYGYLMNDEWFITFGYLMNDD